MIDHVYSIKLYRVVSDRFVAGFLWDSTVDEVFKCAPILRRDLLGKTQSRAIARCWMRGWKVDCLDVW